MNELFHKILLNNKIRNVPFLIMLGACDFLIVIFCLVISYIGAQSSVYNSPYLYIYLFMFSVGLYVIHAILDVMTQWDRGLIQTLKHIGFTTNETASFFVRKVVYLELFFHPVFFLVDMFIAVYLMPYIFPNFNGMTLQTALVAAILSIISMILSIIIHSWKEYRLVNFYDKSQITSTFTKRGLRRASTLLAIGILLMNLIIVLYDSVDAKTIANNETCTDYIVSKHRIEDNDTFSSSHPISRHEISKLKSFHCFKKGGLLSYNLNNNIQLLGRLPDQSPYLKVPYAGLGEDSYNFNLYGADSFIFKQMKILDGKINWKLLSTGKYIIYGAEYDHRGFAYSGKADKKWIHYHSGDRVTLNVNGKKKTFKIMATAETNHTTTEENAIDYQNSEVTFYLPLQIFNTLTNKQTQRFIFNVQGSTVDLDHYLKVNHFYVLSKKQIANSVNKKIKSSEQIGIVINAFISGLGLLCLINSFIIDVNIRRRDIWILRAVGMTNSEINLMLLKNGLFGFIKFFIFVIISNFVLLGTIKYLLKDIVGMRFLMNYFPMTVTILVVMFISAFIPVFAYQKGKDVERIENECF